MVETVKVEGLRELERALLELPRRITRRVLNASLMAGAQPIAKDAQARAPVLKDPDPRRKSGTLRANVRARPVRPQEGHAATVIVYVRKLGAAAMAKFKKGSGKGGAANPDDPYYWRWVELGTSRMTARPYLRPAFESKKTQAVDTIKERIATRIAIEAEKLGKGQ